MLFVSYFIKCDLLLYFSSLCHMFIYLQNVYNVYNVLCYTVGLPITIF